MSSKAIDSLTEQFRAALKNKWGLNEATYPPVNVKFDLNKLIPMCRAEILYTEDMSDKEIKEFLDMFIKELSTEKGIVTLLDNLEYFNQ